MRDPGHTKVKVTPPGTTEMKHDIRFCINCEHHRRLDVIESNARGLKSRCSAPAVRRKQRYSVITGDGYFSDKELFAVCTQINNDGLCALYQEIPQKVVRFERDSGS